MLPSLVSALVVGALAAAAAWTLKPESPAPLVRFSYTLPPQQRFTTLARRLVAVSPDGTVVAYVADRRLYVRRLGELQSVPLQGSESPDGIMVPVFSPDGRSLAFYSVTDGAIKRIALSGGAAVTLCSATAPYGMSWGRDGIAYAEIYPQQRRVLRVPASGGTPQVIATMLPTEMPEGPQVLPDGDTLLVTAGPNTNVGTERWDKAQIVVQSIKTGTRKVIIDGGSDARYLTTGHIAYAVGGTVYAAPFDLRTWSVTGAAFPIIEGVRRAVTGNTGMADFSISGNGTLVYVPGPVGVAAGVGLALVDWNGAITLLNLPAGPYSAPRLSRDGRRIALESSDGKETFIGVFEREPAPTAGLRRLTFGGKANSPVWSPDGSRVAFQSAREGDAAIFVQTADGRSAPERLTRPSTGETHVPQSWFGDVLLFDATQSGKTTLRQFSFKDRHVTPFGGVTSSTETGATFSPDGRWVLYSATEGGSSDVTVQPYPETGAKFMLVKSRNSAPHHAVWAQDGSALLEIPSPGLIERVPVTTVPVFNFGNPQNVPRVYQAGPPGTRRAFDMAPDGRVLGLVAPGQVIGTEGAGQIVVVVNWFQELRARARQ